VLLRTTDDEECCSRRCVLVGPRGARAAAAVAPGRFIFDDWTRYCATLAGLVPHLGASARTDDHPVALRHDHRGLAGAERA
jgi:hypothetical protein